MGKKVFIFSIVLIFILAVAMAGRAVIKRYHPFASNRSRTVNSNLNNNQPLSSNNSSAVNSNLNNNQPLDSSKPLNYPFENQNMYFGFSIVKNQDYLKYVNDLGGTWVSLQPQLTWLGIEKSAGVYDWTELDREVGWLQAGGLDITMDMVPINAFGETREKFNQELARVMKEKRININAAFITLMRDEKLAVKWQLYPHDAETEKLWLSFVQAAVDRYDGDGRNDMPGLKFPVRNWHFVEEFPTMMFDGETYVRLLKPTYAAIKKEYLEALVILPGLAGNYSQAFAFADGYITDPDAGVFDGRKFTRQQIAANSNFKKEKFSYETILRDGKGYFDVVDIHLYEPKETFLEGKIDYLNAKMKEFGYSRPIWCIEGGGPFKNMPGDNSKQGDAYFGFWTAKENAEFVVKLQVLAAAKGIKRNHWGLTETGGSGYWVGPWRVMALMTVEGVKKPAYHAYKLLAEKLKDFTSVKDLSFNGIRLFEFYLPNGKVYIVWSFDQDAKVYNLSAKLGTSTFKVTPIVTSVKNDGSPIMPPIVQSLANTTSLSLTPVFLEKK